MKATPLLVFLLLQFLQSFFFSFSVVSFTERVEPPAIFACKFLELLMRQKIESVRSCPKFYICLL